MREIRGGSIDSTNRLGYTRRVEYKPEAELRNILKQPIHDANLKLTANAVIFAGISINACTFATGPDAALMSLQVCIKNKTKRNQEHDQTIERKTND